MPTWTTELHGLVALLTFTRPSENLMDFAAMIEARRGNRLASRAAARLPTAPVMSPMEPTLQPRRGQAR